jgi:hypothetical protein
MFVTVLSWPHLRQMPYFYVIFPHKRHFECKEHVNDCARGCGCVHVHVWFVMFALKIVTNSSFLGEKKQCETLKSFVTYEDRIEVPHICFQCQSEVPNVVEAGCVVSEVQNKERQKAYFI